MKVLHVVTSLEVGGAEKLMVSLINALPGVEHRVFSLRGSGPLLSELGEVGTYLSSQNRRARNLKRFAQVLSDFRPDVVQTWLLHADLFTTQAFRLLRDTPVIWGFHISHEPGSTGRWRLHLAARAAALASRAIPEAIVACGDSAAQAAKKWGYSAGRIRVIPNGVDTNYFKSGSKPGNFPRAVIAPARWHSDKGHETLFDAWIEVQKSGVQGVLLLVGKGMTTENPQVARFLRNPLVEGTVLCKGQQTDIRSVFNSGDVVVMSSRREALPLALCEAMACGLVPVVSSAGDMPSVVGESGFVTRPQDSRGLASALSQVLSMKPEELCERSVEARQRIEMFYSIDSCATQYVSLWNEVRR